MLGCSLVDIEEEENPSLKRLMRVIRYDLPISCLRDMLS